MALCQLGCRLEYWERGGEGNDGRGEKGASGGFDGWKIKDDLKE